MYIGQIAKQSYDLYSQFVLVLFSPLIHSFAPPYAVFCIVIVMCSHFHHFSGGNCVAIVCIFFLFFAIFKFYVHSAFTTYVIREFFSSLYCNMAIITNIRYSFCHVTWNCLI